MKLFATSLLLLSVVAFSSCKKEVTEVVNQAYSTVFTIQPNQWSATSNGQGYTTSLDIPELNSNILNYGGIVVYLSFDKGDTYEAIPEVFNGITYGTYHGVGYIGIDYYRVGGGAVSLPGDIIKAKVVLLDPAPL